MKAAGVSPVDAALRSGRTPMSARLALPHIPGVDAAGVVDEIGPGVTGVAPGDEVFGSVELAGLGGASAEFAILRSWAPKPATMPWAQAGAAGTSVETATRALDLLDVHPGMTLLIDGAAGGVGSVAVQLAVARGARVIGTARPSNHDFLRKLGATPITYGPDLPTRVTSTNHPLNPTSAGANRALDPAGAHLDHARDVAGTRDVRALNADGAPADRAHSAAGALDHHALNAAGARVDRALDVAGAGVDRALDAAGPRVDRALDAAGPRVDRALDAAGPRVDRALDVAGAGSLPELISLTGDPASVLSLADFSAASHGVRLSMGELAGEPHGRHGLRAAAELFTQGRFVIPIEAEFSLMNAAAAHTAVESGSRRGKIVLILDDHPA
ncbi:hypothetical protein L3i22_063330 [Actinoplanes sp. L3-i22]|nr:hypothetical protein L3i22_063330 [Actinoplanes sp. L3-i22]